MEVNKNIYRGLSLSDRIMGPFYFLPLKTWFVLLTFYKLLVCVCTYVLLEKKKAAPISWGCKDILKKNGRHICTRVVPLFLPHPGKSLTVTL